MKKVTKKAKIRFALKQALLESYGKAGFTTTADKFYRIFCKKLKII